MNAECLYREIVTCVDNTLIVKLILRLPEVLVYFVSFLAGTSRMTPMYVRHRGAFYGRGTACIEFHSNGSYVLPLTPVPHCCSL